MTIVDDITVEQLYNHDDYSELEYDIGDCLEVGPNGYDDHYYEIIGTLFELSTRWLELDTPLTKDRAIVCIREINNIQKKVGIPKVNVCDYRDVIYRLIDQDEGIENYYYDHVQNVGDRDYRDEFGYTNWLSCMIDCHHKYQKEQILDSKGYEEYVAFIFICWMEVNRELTMYDRFKHTQIRIKSACSIW